MRWLCWRAVCGSREEPVRHQLLQDVECGFDHPARAARGRRGRRCRSVGAGWHQPGGGTGDAQGCALAHFTMRVSCACRMTASTAAAWASLRTCAELCSAAAAAWRHGARRRAAQGGARGGGRRGWGGAGGPLRPRAELTRGGRRAARGGRPESASVGKEGGARTSRVGPSSSSRRPLEVRRDGETGVGALVDGGSERSRACRVIRAGWVQGEPPARVTESAGSRWRAGVRPKRYRVRAVAPTPSREARARTTCRPPAGGSA